jgi:hypothetical protein
LVDMILLLVVIDIAGLLRTNSSVCGITCLLRFRLSTSL